MFTDTKAFSGFAVADLDQAQAFYADTLGIRTSVLDAEFGLLQLHLADDRNTLIYKKPDAQPANFTILNFPVDDIDEAVDYLVEHGVELERYEGFDQDEKGVMRGLSRDMGPDIAWFKDPAGNLLSVLQEK